MKINRIFEKVFAKIKSSREKEYFLIHQKRYSYLLQKISQLKLKKTAKILDVGCYPPHLLEALENYGFEVWGISSPHEPITHPKVAILNIETENLPFQNNFFDLVIFSEILEHLLHNPIPVLKELKRVLKNSGSLLITTPNVACLKNRLHLLLGQNIYFNLDQLLATTPQNLNIYHRHNRLYTMAEVAWLLKKAKFKIKKKEYFIGSSFLKLSSQGLIGKLTAYCVVIIQNILPTFRNYLFIKAEK